MLGTSMPPFIFLECTSLRLSTDYGHMMRGSNLLLSSQTEKLTAATKFSAYLGLKQYKAKEVQHFNHLALTYWPQTFSTY